MSALSAALESLAKHGPMLLLGVTIVLAGGCLAMAAHRHPAQRRRLGIATAFACLAYLLLALVPLPRVFGTPDEEPVVVAAERAATSPQLDSPPRDRAILAVLDRELGPAARPNAIAATPATANATPNVPAAVPADPLQWSTLLALGWCLGALFVMLRGAWGLARLHSLLRRTRGAPSAVLRHLALPPHVSVRIARTSVRPFCTGWLRPVVVLGPEMLEPRREGQTLAVLRHELAHLRARDPLVQLLLVTLAVPLFCHPLFWWLCRDVRFQSELLADDAAAASSRTTYARELIDLAGRDQPALAAAGTVAVFHRPSDFYRRIQMLLQREGPLSTSTSRARRFTHALATLSLVATAAGLFGVPANAQDPRGRAVRKENEALRAEVEAMRAAIQQLRDELQRTPGSAPSGTTPAEPMPGATLSPPATTMAQAQVLDQLSRRSPGTLAPDTSAGLLEALLRRDPGTHRSLDDVFGKAVPGERSVGQDGTPIGEPAIAPVPSLGALELLRHTQMAEVPTLNNLPTLDKVFLADANGLPSRMVNVLPPERTAPVAATEAIAELASRCLDLQGELELAEVTAAETKQLAENGVGSSADARRAAVQLRTLQKKFAVVSKLVAGEIEATQSELAWLVRKREGADQTEQLRLDMQLHRARMRLEALQAVK